MGALLLLLLIPLSTLSPSDAAWCVCRSDMSTTALQKTLDFACGDGADCTPILQNGACYNPNTVLAHCSYAANSYYQRKGQAQDACDFSGTTVLSSTDPGGNGCSYPASPRCLETTKTALTLLRLHGISTGGSSTTPTTLEGTGSMPTSSTTNTSSFTPSTTTGTGGVLGVVPTGTGSFDASDAALLPNRVLIMPSLLFMFAVLFASLENFI